nr:MAG TPA: hypothetical protein [Caudoviricetes sp.]
MSPVYHAAGSQASRKRLRSHIRRRCATNGSPLLPGGGR